MQSVKLNHFLSKSILFVISLGFLIALIAYILAKDMEQKKHDKEFLHLFEQSVSAIQRELDLNLEVIRSLKQFYDASNHVDRKEFHIFVKESIKRYETIQALEWIPKVPHNQRTTYEQQASQELKQGYSFKEKNDDKMIVAKQRKYYYPVYYVEPLQGNEKALGFDLASSKVRLKSLEEAESLNKLLVSSKIKLVQETSNSYAFLVFNPVWSKKEDKNLEGFVLGVYRINDIIKNALKYNMEGAVKLNIWLADVTHSRKNPDLLFSNTNVSQFAHYDSKLLDIEGRVWRLFAKPNKLLYEKYFGGFPFLIASVLVIITGLISYILALRISKEESLKKVVEDKTLRIKDTNSKYESLLQMFDKKVIASKTDLSGKITYVTQAFCDISGYSQEELIGKNHNIVRHPDMPKDIYEKLWSTIKAGDTFRGEIKNKRKDGTYYWVEVTIEPEFDTDYNMIGYSAVREDITAKKQIEEFNKTLANKIEEAVIDNTKKDKLLLEQSKMAAMGEMIGAIAHQWRQPLNTLAIKIQFLEDDYEDELINQAYLKEYSNESMKLINFMSKTIDDFRNFFTIDKEKALFYVREKIEETTDILEIQLRNHKIELLVLGEDFEYSGYPSEFQQVILNIVNNAKDALIEKEIEDGKISVQLDKTNHMITISDNAGGIPTEVINRIFEPYFTTKEQGKGTGLGLYMSKMIIEDNMHGSINVTNTDDGAQFVIQLGETDE